MIFKQKFLRSMLALALLVSFGMPALPVSAAGASISLTANKSTVASGGTVIIGVYMNGGGSAINAVQTDISYPTSKLQYIGFSATGSAFEISATNGGSDGLASVARGTTSPVSGSGLVGTMTFKALTGSGSASFGVAGSSSLVSDGNPIAYGSSGAGITFGAAAPAATTTPAAAAKAAAPAPPKDTTAPIISSVKASNVTPFSATITWTTDEAADSGIEYGLDTSYGLSGSAAATGTVHSVALNSAFLTPQTLLHYHVKSTDAVGNVATGTDQTLQLPGVTVTVIVRGPDGKPQSGATVTLDGSTGVTDSKGSVTLASGLGNKKVTSTYQGQTVQQPVTVVKSAKPLPAIQLDFAKQSMNRWMLISIGLLVVVITLLAIDGFLFGSRMLARLAGLKIRKPQPKPLAPVEEPIAPIVPIEPTPIPAVTEKPKIIKHSMFHKSKKPAPVPMPTQESKPVDEPDIIPAEPFLPLLSDASEDEDLSKVEKKVVAIMEEAPTTSKPVRIHEEDTPLDITTPTTKPITISLQPLEEPITPAVLPTAPELPTASDQVAAVAERLKKPAPKKSPSTSKAKKATKKISIS